MVASMPAPLAIGSTRVIAIVRFHEGGDLATALAALEREAGAVAVALGSELVGRAAPVSDEELDRIESQAARAVANVRSIAPA